MIDNGESLIELPKSWVWTTLKDVCLQTQYGWTTSAAQQGRLHLLRTTDITSGKINWECVPFCEKEPDEKGKYILEDGDIVISRAGSVGFSLLIKNPKESVFASYLIRFKPLIDKNYVAYFLKTPFYWGAISEKKLGIALANVNATKLKEISIPVAPLKEQKRIVTKIEELFTRLDAGVEALKKVKAELKRYRQTVLKAAFEGKLTNDNTSDCGWPKSWTVVKWGDVCEMCLGKMLDNKKNKGEYEPYLRNLNVRWREFDFTDLLEMRFEPHEQERYGLIEGDLVVCEGGEPGRAAIWKGQVPNMKIQKALHRIRLQADVLNSFVLYFLMLSSQNGYLERYFTGTTIKHLTGRKLRMMELPLPPLKTQKQLVCEIERHFSIADEVEQTIEKSLKESDRLRQSILKRAFEGKLVPQDPNDEPAEKLLQRIEAEKIRLQPKPKTCGRRRRNVNTKT